MPDLRVALEELKEESDSGALETAVEAKVRARRRLIWAIGAVVALVIAAAGTWFVQSGKKPPEAPLVAVPLTSYPGAESYPSFSPDGTQVAFQWCQEVPGSSKNCDIFVKQIGMEPPSRLTDTPAAFVELSPVWSPDGRFIAFIRWLALSATRFSLILIPQRGGRERVLAELDMSGVGDVTDSPYLAWTPDSKWIVGPVPEAGHRWSLYLFSTETGERRKLTSPPDGALGDTAPAVSPEGRTLAFARQFTDRSRSDLCLLRFGEGYTAQENPEGIRLDTPYNIGATWTPDGREIVFATRSGLWRIAASKSATPQRLSFAPDEASEPTLSRQGNRLAYTVSRYDSNIWRVNLKGPGQTPDAPARFVSSTRNEYDPAYSPDGKRIAFDSERSGASEVWVCDSDGSNPVQLTSLGGPEIYGPKWSPDNQSIAFHAAPGGESYVHVISANGGVPRRITDAPANGKWPCWSRDGRSIYFAADASDGRQIWVIPVTGGKAVQITRDAGADMPHESPDGRFVYYSKGGPFPQSIWRVSIEGGEATKLLDGVHSKALWTVRGDGIYFFTKPDEKGRSDLSIYEFATGKTRKVLTIERPVTYLVDVSPDGRTILYTQTDEAGSDLMLVENFR